MILSNHVFFRKNLEVVALVASRVARLDATVSKWLMSHEVSFSEMLSRAFSATPLTGSSKIFLSRVTATNMPAYA